LTGINSYVIILPLKAQNAIYNHSFDKRNYRQGDLL